MIFKAQQKPGSAAAQPTAASKYDYVICSDILSRSCCVPNQHTPNLLGALGNGITGTCSSVNTNLSHFSACAVWPVTSGICGTGQEGGSKTV
jgi:hypothetical protein